MAKPTSMQDRSEVDALIDLYLGQLALDFGVASVPKLFSRFWVYLFSDGEELSDRQYSLLMQVFTLRDTQEFELRVSNLPLKSSTITLERDKKDFRRLGLIFTQRLYYPARPGEMPHMYAQRWDLRSLFYNLALVAQEWLKNQQVLVDDWKLNGSQGPKPIYNFPKGYRWEVRLPVDVAIDILKDVYYPIPEKWVQRAQEIASSLPAGLETAPELLPTGLKTSGTEELLPTEPNWSGTAPTGLNKSGTEGLPTGLKTSGTPPTEPNKSGTPTGLKTSGTMPTGLKKSGHLLEDEEEEEGGRLGETAPGDPAQQVFAYFARCKGLSDHQPSRKEQSALKAMLTEGYSLQEILDWIDLAFTRSSKPQHFTFVHILARQSRLAMDNRPPQRSDLPDAGRSDLHPNQPDSGSQTITEVDIQAALDIYQSTGREVNSDVLARLRLLAGRCDAAAREQGSTGGAWLADALEAALGIADPNRVLNYAASTLKDWTANGKPGGATKTVDTALEELAPELIIFQEATGGRLPLPDQRQIVINAIRQCSFTAIYLRPFWDAWVAQDRKRSSLDWLLDWADKGAIPQPYYGKTQTSDKPEFKSLSTIQTLMKKYGGTNP